MSQAGPVAGGRGAGRLEWRPFTPSRNRHDPPRHAAHPDACRVLRCWAPGELGKEVAIELQRFGVEVIAADRCFDAPAMQVAHRSHVLDMLDPAALEALIAQEKPHPGGARDRGHPYRNAAQARTRGRPARGAHRARHPADDGPREGIRRLAAETLGLPTSPYRFVDTAEGAATAPPSPRSACHAWSSR